MTRGTAQEVSAATRAGELLGHLLATGSPEAALAAFPEMAARMRAIPNLPAEVLDRLPVLWRELEELAERWDLGELKTTGGDNAVETNRAPNTQRARQGEESAENDETA